MKNQPSFWGGCKHFYPALQWRKRTPQSAQCLSDNRCTVSSFCHSQATPEHLHILHMKKQTLFSKLGQVSSNFLVRPILQPAAEGSYVLSSLPGVAFLALLSLRGTGKGENFLLHIHVMNLAVFVFLQSAVLMAFSGHCNPTPIPRHQQFVLLVQQSPGAFTTKLDLGWARSLQVKPWVCSNMAGDQHLSRTISMKIYAELLTW